MDLGKGAKQLGQISTTFMKVQYGAAVARLIAAMHAVSIEVFTRREFGCRYASKTNLVFGIVLIGFYSGLGGWVISALNHEKISVLMESLYTGAICMAVWHRVSIWRKRRKGEILHSRYSGSSHLEPLLSFTGISPEAIKMYVEPVCLFLLGGVASAFHETTVATWLWIGSISIFAQESLSAQMEENDILDQQDAVIESGYRRRALSGKI